MTESRSTYRDRCTDGVAWQKRLRDKFLDEGTPAVPHLDLKRAIVRPVSLKLARQVILKYEWLGTLPSVARFRFGIFFGPYCAGVTCVGVGSGGANIHAHDLFGVRAKELATLVRGACVHWAPKGTNSKLVSWTCRLLAREKRARVILAYADTDAGEIGTIYQACGWTCVGRDGATSWTWVDPKTGRNVNRKTAHDLSKSKGGSWRHWHQEMVKAGWVRLRVNQKLRYAKALDKRDREVVAKLDSLRVAYPKRAEEFGSTRPRGEGPVQIRDRRSTE